MGERGDVGVRFRLPHRCSRSDLLITSSISDTLHHMPHTLTHTSRPIHTVSSRPVHHRSRFVHETQLVLSCAFTGCQPGQR